MKLTTNEIAGRLFEQLLQRYIERVSYAAKYNEMVVQKGGRFVPDHLALRTFNAHTGEQPEGIKAFGHFLQLLGYKIAGKYAFPDKQLNAVHFEHSDEALPLIFVSQIEVYHLPGRAQKIIGNSVAETPFLLSDKSIGLMKILEEKNYLPIEAAEFLINDFVHYFRRPWDIPHKTDVLDLNDISQYAAWVLLHGNSVTHFAASINKQNVPEWPDIETTGNALVLAGIPMKAVIEGERGSKLRQTVTYPVYELVKVSGDEGIEQINWSYAYLELTERNFQEENGISKLYRGFLDTQAAHLFDITKPRNK